MTYTSLPFMACKEICLLSWVEKNVKINLSIWIEVRLDEYWLKSSASSCVRLVQWIILYKICLKVLKINFFQLFFIHSYYLLLFPWWFFSPIFHQRKTKAEHPKNNHLPINFVLHPQSSRSSYIFPFWISFYSHCSVPNLYLNTSSLFLFLQTSLVRRQINPLASVSFSPPSVPPAQQRAYISYSIFTISCIMQ